VVSADAAKGLPAGLILPADIINTDILSDWCRKQDEDDTSPRRGGIPVEQQAFPDRHARMEGRKEDPWPKPCLQEDRF
jgi:hypothetical protein